MRCAEFIADSSPATRVPTDRGGTTPRWSFLSLHAPPRYSYSLDYSSSFDRNLRLAAKAAVSTAAYALSSLTFSVLRLESRSQAFASPLRDESSPAMSARSSKGVPGQGPTTRPRQLWQIPPPADQSVTPCAFWCLQEGVMVTTILGARKGRRTMGSKKRGDPEEALDKTVGPSGRSHRECNGRQEP